LAFSAASVTLERLLVLDEVDALGLLEVAGEPLHDALVEVVAAEEGVAGGGEHLEDAVANLEDGDVEGTASEVEDEDGLVGLLLEAVRQGRGGGLVDDAEHLDARNLTGILGRLALGVVEVGGDGDDRLGDGVAEVGGGVVAELAEHLRGDLLGGEVLARDAALDLHVSGVTLDDGVGRLAVLVANLVPAAADEALDGEEGVLGVNHALTLGDLADEAVAVLGVGDDGRGGAATLGVGHDGGGATLHGGDRGVGGAEVDTDDLLRDDAEGLVGGDAAAHGHRASLEGLAGEAGHADSLTAAGEGLADLHGAGGHGGLSGDTSAHLVSLT